jgi:iron(III) transport system substrate-binding protein
MHGGNEIAGALRRVNAPLRDRPKRRAASRRRTVMAGVAVGAMLAMVTACGASPVAGGGGKGSGAATYKKLNALPAAQQESTALQMAKDEGKTVSFYTSYASDAAAAVKKGFEAKYGITVNLYRAQSGDVLQRVLQESGARHLGADVVEASAPEMNDMSDQSLFAPYRGANRQLVGADGQFDTWTADYFNLMLPAWNTKLIGPGQEPKSWEDLADPRFKNKLLIDPTDSDWYAALTLYWQQHGKTADQIDALWKGIVKNSRVSKGHSTNAELLSAGQTPATAVMYNYITALAMQKGAPVTYKNADGVADIPAFSRPNGVALLKDAKHSAAAWLLTNWLLSVDGGQKILAANFQVPSTTKPGTGLFKDFTIAKYPTEEMHKNQKLWDSRYDALLRGVPAR